MIDTEDALERIARRLHLPSPERCLLALAATFFGLVFAAGAWPLSDVPFYLLLGVVGLSGVVAVVLAVVVVGVVWFLIVANSIAWVRDRVTGPRFSTGLELWDHWIDGKTLIGGDSMDDELPTKSKPKVYDEAEIPAMLVEHGLEDWYLEDGWLRRKYNTDGWPTTLMLVNAVGFLCEAAWHHADLSVTWGKVWVKLKTHSAGGITDKDFALARKIEELALWRPAPGGPLEGTPHPFVQARK